MINANALCTSQVSGNSRDSYRTPPKLMTRARGGFDLDLPADLLRKIKGFRVELETLELGIYEVGHFERWTHVMSRLTRFPAEFEIQSLVTRDGRQ